MINIVIIMQIINLSIKSKDTFHEDCFNHKLEEIIEENVLEIFNLPVPKQRITSDISYLLNYVRFISQFVLPLISSLFNFIFILNNIYY